MRDIIRKMCCLGICIVLCLCCGCREKETFTLKEATEEDTKEKEELQEYAGSGKELKEVGTQFVYVCGAVFAPGVYELKQGSRVYEAVEAAGGMTSEADETYLNQAELTEDGERIYVPSKEETRKEESENSAGMEGRMPGDAGKVNLNTAAKEELMTLTGIGESKAESIIRYRKENGAFRSIEDIMKIEGIKSGVFNKIKEDIRVK